MTETARVLGDDELVLVFTYAQAGFGHLRVTDALYHGLPASANPILLETHDDSLNFLHRISSIHPWARALMELIQRGRIEEIVTFFYRYYLRSDTQRIKQQLSTIIEQRITLPTKVLVVSTHFGLAHQVAAIKKQLEHEKKVKIFLVVQVTDDSPQKIWYVPGADLILVPSEYTKAQLERYGKQHELEPVEFEVSPYPVSPTLSHVLTEHKFNVRVHQLHAGSDAPIHVAIPISGAAVGLEYVTQVIDNLFLKSQRFKFFVITKSAIHTQSFINEMLKRPYVHLHASSVDKGVVEQYEQLYRHELLSLEITKPSEQAFKALIDPERIGGTLLLFSQPVGRQEYDNLHFLRKHKLIPSQTTQNLLWRRAQKQEHVDSLILKTALMWRGIELPRDPEEASRFIWWCLQQGIFAAMVQRKIAPAHENIEHPEILGAESSHLFWSSVASLISSD